MKLRYLFFIILMLLVINVKAEEKCERKELNRIRELARKVEFDYDYELVDGVAKFSVKAVNLNEDLKVLIIEDYYMDKYVEFKDNSTHTATIDNFNSGDKVVITIKGYVANRCSGETLLTKTIKLPYYNYFYNEDNCEGNEDFKYCKLLVDTNISQKIFDSQYTSYMMNKNAVKEEKIVEEDRTNRKLLRIIGYIMVSGGVLAGATMIIVGKIKRNSL